MHKDIIYIDVDDDITNIIGKVKDSKSKTVVLVPPKRIGVLQSAVNLRLITRAGKQAGKQVSLVTNNSSLTALATTAAIPVARNLQSEPELGEIPALDIDDEDVIDGGALPIGEHAKQGESKKDLAETALVNSLAEAPKDGEDLKAPKVKSRPKVPDFTAFRKKLILGVGGGVLLIGFLIWAIFIAPHATVVISAKTTSESINVPVSILTTANTDLAASTIKAVSQEQSADKSVDFTATGQKDAGSKATGTVKYSNGSPNAVSISSGTQLSSNGLVFVTDAAVTVPGATLSFSCPGDHVCPGGASGSVTAAQTGSSYNAASGSLSGAPGGVSASFAAPTSGGVTKMITVVSDADVQKAKEAIAGQDIQPIKTALKSKLSVTSTPIEESFAIDYTNVNAAPAVGQEATTAKLSTKVVYKMYGVEKKEIDAFLDAYLKKVLTGKTNQKVYKNGSDGMVLQEASAVQDGAKATLIATAHIGPVIDEKQVKDIAKGKKSGEVQQTLETIPGIEDVDVKYFPFWISSVPNDANRITIEFKLNESK